MILPAEKFFTRGRASIEHNILKEVGVGKINSDSRPGELWKKNNFIAFEISQLTLNEEINRWWEKKVEQNTLSPPNSTLYFFDAKLKITSYQKIQSKYTKLCVLKKKKVKLNSFITIASVRRWHHKNIQFNLNIFHIPRAGRLLRMVGEKYTNFSLSHLPWLCTHYKS